MRSWNDTLVDKREDALIAQCNGIRNVTVADIRKELDNWRSCIKLKNYVLDPSVMTFRKAKQHAVTQKFRILVLRDSREDLSHIGILFDEFRVGINVLAIHSWSSHENVNVLFNSEDEKRSSSVVVGQIFEILVSLFGQKRIDQSPVHFGLRRRGELHGNSRSRHLKRERDEKKEEEKRRRREEEKKRGREEEKRREEEEEEEKKKKKRREEKRREGKSEKEGAGSEKLKDAAQAVQGVHDRTHRPPKETLTLGSKFNTFAIILEHDEGWPVARAEPTHRGASRANRGLCRGRNMLCVWETREKKELTVFLLFLLSSRHAKRPFRSTAS